MLLGTAGWTEDVLRHFPDLVKNVVRGAAGIAAIIVGWHGTRPVRFPVRCLHPGERVVKARENIPNSRARVKNQPKWAD